ncbi:MAG: glutathione S-transferase family protein [Marinicaulis sp.]|nr:glutathione S-transferase family protein [Marinicaulis sp.]
MSEELKLYGDPISGNCLKTKWTADYLGLNYEWIPLEILTGATRTDEFLKINPFGQVPTAVLPDGSVLTQSNAIAVNLAEASGGELFGADDYERAQVFQWLFWEQNSHEPYIAGRRFRLAYKKQPETEIDVEWLPRGHAALERMEGVLTENDFLVGNGLTLADISLVAYTRVAGEGGFDLGKYPAIRAWIGRVEKTLDLQPIGDA